MSSTPRLQVPRCTRCSTLEVVGTDPLLKRAEGTCPPAGAVEEVEAVRQGAGSYWPNQPWIQSPPSAGSADFGWNSADWHWGRDPKSNTEAGAECSVCGKAPGAASSTTCGGSTTLVGNLQN